MRVNLELSVFVFVCGIFKIKCVRRRDVIIEEEPGGKIQQNTINSYSAPYSFTH